MACLRNYSNDTVSHGVLEERRQRQNVGRVLSTAENEDVDVTYSEREFDIYMDAQYQSDRAGISNSEQSRLHHEMVTDNAVGISNSNFQSAGRRVAPVKWGSTFWKDCQPMDRQGGSDSGQESKSDHKNLEGSVYNSSDDRLESEVDEAQKEVGRAQRGHSDIPADEMLSDEYYEQGGEERSDTMHYGGFGNSVGLNTRPQSKHVSVSTMFLSVPMWPGFQEF